MICERVGWLPGVRPRGKPHPERIVIDKGDKWADELREGRKGYGLDRPYGPKAVALELGGLEPKSLPAAILPEDPSEPEEAPVVMPDLPGMPTPADQNEQPNQDAAHVELDDLPF